MTTLISREKLSKKILGDLWVIKFCQNWIFGQKFDFLKCVIVCTSCLPWSTCLVHNSTLTLPITLTVKHSFYAFYEHFKWSGFFYFTGDRGRRRSKFVLYRRPKANGVVKSRNYKVNEAKNSQAVLNVQQHSISYTLSKNKAVIEEYTHDEQSDLFQVKKIRFFFLVKSSRARLN